MFFRSPGSGLGLFTGNVSQRRRFERLALEKMREAAGRDMRKATRRQRDFRRFYGY